MAAVTPLDPTPPTAPSPAGRGRGPLLVAGIGAIALLALLFAAVDTGDGGPPTVAPAPPVTRPVAELVVHTAPDGRFEVTYPASWTLADVDLTPNGGVGPELFAVATFEMRRGGPCPQQPKRALDDLGPTDALVWVEERPGTTVNPLRPASFIPEVVGVDEGSDPFVCMDVAERADLGVLRWIPFRDAGSDFHAIVAVGRDAPASLLTEAGAVLDSFALSPHEE